MAKVGPQGNPATAVHQSVVMWLPRFRDVMEAKHDAVTALRDPNGVWLFHYKVFRADGQPITSQVPFNADGPRLVRGEELLRWGTLRIGPGVWVLSESVHIVGLYHGFLVLRNVPDPAPWLPMSEER